MTTPTTSTASTLGPAEYDPFYEILEKEFLANVTGVTIESAMEHLFKNDLETINALGSICVAAAVSQRKAVDDKFTAAIRANAKVTAAVNNYFTLNNALKFTELVFIGHLLIASGFAKENKTVKAWILKMGNKSLHAYNLNGVSEERAKILRQYQNKFQSTPFNDAATVLGNAIDMDTGLFTAKGKLAIMKKYDIPIPAPAP